MNYIDEYTNKSDEELISIIRQGNQSALEYLMIRYQNVVKSKSTKYYIYGGDNNDAFQEGMIGLYLAIKNFNPTEHASFKTFANLCIERKLITAIKNANRQKHSILNTAISINKDVYDDKDSEEITSHISINNTAEDPFEIIANNEYYMKINNDINNALSKHEKEVLEEFKEGKSYNEIANILSCNTKSVDTAMTRIRKKANIIKEKYKDY